MNIYCVSEAAADSKHNKTDATDEDTILRNIPIHDILRPQKRPTKIYRRHFQMHLGKNHYIFILVPLKFLRV